ncbi:MAG TPA: hypothetical protein VL282_07435, partial [Tepidisphaeraceae bacterium]|nr:hypothetical protein [Tepidisphaeraceae bacterium]
MEATRFDITLRGVQKYSIGLLCALVAILLGHLFRPVLGREGPFLWAMVAILFAAYFAGWGPALLAIAVMTFHLAWTL